MSPPRMILRGALESLLEAAAVGRWSAQRAQQQVRVTSLLNVGHERQQQSAGPSSEGGREQSTVVEEARMIRLASALEDLGETRVDRLAGLCNLSGLVETSPALLLRRFEWRDGLLAPQPDEASTLRAWCRPTLSGPIHGGFLRSQPHADAFIASYGRFVERKLIDPVFEAVANLRRAAVAAVTSPVDFAVEAMCRVLSWEVAACPKAPPKAGSAYYEPASASELLDVVLVQRRRGESEPRLEMYARVPAYALSALAPRGEFSLRQRNGERFITYTAFGLTSVFPIWRSFNFYAEWSQTSSSVSQFAIVACAASLAYGAWRGAGANRERLLHSLHRTLRLHRTAAGVHLHQHLERCAARCVARGASDALHGEVLDAETEAAAADLLAAVGLRGPSGLVEPSGAAAVLHAFLNHSNPGHRRDDDTTK